MDNNKALFSQLSRLWPHISYLRRKQLASFSVLLLLGTIAEVVSLGMVLPFLGVLTAPNEVYKHPWAQPIVSGLELTSPEQLLLPLSLLFALTAVLSGVTRLALLWVQTRLGNNIGNDLGSAAYRRTLYQPYEVHAARNSSEVMSVLMTKINTTIYFMIIPLFMLVTSSVIIITVAVFLFIVDPELTVLTILGVGILYVLVAYITKKRLTQNSQYVTDRQSDVAKIVQEGLGGIRDVLIEGLQETYFKIFRRVDGQLRRALSNIAIMGGAPRPVIEAFSMVLISLIAYILTRRQDEIGMVLPILGTIALAAQRLMPLVQQGYSSWASMLGGQASLNDVLGLLEQPLPDYNGRLVTSPLPFKRQISLAGLKFSYGTTGPSVLSNINLQIPRGSRVGFIGTTGSGKSTLLDIIMGLLSPTSGTICIDDVVLDEANQREWQAHIAHVPQTIFLTDASIAENIAFGVQKEDIDWDRIKEVGEHAQISGLIKSSPDGYETLVGERGLRLSGGQRQRIGIARALYKKADVLVFDEATSALDTNTESAVMKALESMDKNLTILMVAHRTTTLKNCDQIIALDKGHLEIIGNYQDMVGRDA
jgi:ABC-type multidrug transport system fused ATPase/permease subunit